MSGLLTRAVGERSLLVEVGDNRTARALAAHVGRELAGDVEDVVPGHETVLIVGRRHRLPPAALAGWDPASAPELPDPRTHELAVRYDGPDLETIAAECGFSVEEVVARHQAPEYTVAFFGFAPGFAYLLGGDPRLRPGRLPEPRSRVLAGAVALAGEYAAVYPRESPGGWRLLGTSPVRLFDPTRKPAALLALGDQVRFRTAADA